MNARSMLVAGLSLVLAACQGPGAAGDREGAASLEQALERLQVTLGEEVENVPNFRLNGWARIDTTHLMVTAGLHDHYLLTLLQPCFGLDYAFRIAIESRSFMLTRFDDVMVSGMHDGLERCRIERIHRLDDKPDAEN